MHTKSRKKIQRKVRSMIQGQVMPWWDLFFEPVNQILSLGITQWLPSFVVAGGLQPYFYSQWSMCSRRFLLPPHPLFNLSNIKTVQLLSF